MTPKRKRKTKSPRVALNKAERDILRAMDPEMRRHYRRALVAFKTDTPKELIKIARSVGFELWPGMTDSPTPKRGK